MEKRKLSAIPRAKATQEMLDLSKQLNNKKHIMTAELIEDNKILLLYFYEIATLKKGKTEAAFRTFLSADDYITQDLSVSKVKWKTASFAMMEDFSYYESHWDSKKNKYNHDETIFISSELEKELIIKFFKSYIRTNDSNIIWNAIYRYQEIIKSKRLDARHKAEKDAIDAVMKDVKEEPKEFKEWAFEQAMSFSRYLIYEETEKGIARCECTHCKKTSLVSRKKVRFRNNEKGVCPSCGSRVTIKAKGKLPSRITDERWVVYIDPTVEGFIWRYFHAYREIHKNPESSYCQKRVSQGIKEYCRVFYTFADGKPRKAAYEYTEYKQSGTTRWCHDEDKVLCGICILYPDNLPQAWGHTPMKYSALEVLSSNIPTTALRYEWGIKRFLSFPALEWLCKMGLNQLAKKIINDEHHGSTGKINMEAKTIYTILGLNKVNTKIMQKIDGNYDELRILQVAQKIGLHFEPEKLKEYYETFECNTELLEQVNRKVSLHKIVKYISKESERYPIGEKGGCWRYSYNRYQEREDPRIERKKNMANDWLEYLDWCKDLKYDLNNMFIYMPNNFKFVHDRTAKEHQEFQDKRATAEKRKRENAAKKAMEQTRKAMEEIFKQNEGVGAFEIKGKGLIIVVPQSGDEIRAEGSALHHCVGGYVERVAKGETNIFFIRRAEKPNEPYYTMEWKNDEIAQVRGSHNCSMTPEVKAFVNIFEKKMKEYGRESNKHRKAG